MGKYADQRLEELGGERILAVGLGDDAGSLEEDYEKWKEDLWPSVLAAASQLVSGAWMHAMWP
jgi:NADPH-ferrihemoprotein reductase